MSCLTKCLPCFFKNNDDVEKNSNVKENQESNKVNERDLLMKLTSEKKGRYTNYYLNEEKVEKLQLKDDSYEVRIIDIYDADTVKCVLFFRGKPSIVKLRLDGIDTPEMKPDSNDENLCIKEKALAIIAKIVIYKLINQNDDLLFIKTHGSEKYGRTLATLYKNKDSDISFNQILVNLNLADVYHGKTKEKNFSKHFLNMRDSNGIINTYENKENTLEDVYKFIKQIYPLKIPN